MTFAKLQKFLMALPGVETNVQWGDDHVFRVGGKIFAVADEGAVSFKVDPEDFVGWLDQPDVKPAPYLARNQWVLAEFSVGGLEDGLRRSYELIRGKLPKKVQASLSPMSETTSRPAKKSRPGPKGSA